LGIEKRLQKIEGRGVQHCNINFCKKIWQAGRHVDVMVSMVGELMIEKGYLG
jgi:hypothetical protein